MRVHPPTTNHQRLGLVNIRGETLVTELVGYLFHDHHGVVGFLAVVGVEDVGGWDGERGHGPF